MVVKFQEMRIGIDLGGTKIEGILMDREGNVTQVIRKAAPRGHYERTVRAITELVRELDILAVGKCSVGIATPGTWIPDRSAMKLSLIHISEPTRPY